MSTAQRARRQGRVVEIERTPCRLDPIVGEQTPELARGPRWLEPPIVLLLVSSALLFALGSAMTSVVISIVGAVSLVAAFSVDTRHERELRNLRRSRELHRGRSRHGSTAQSRPRGPSRPRTRVEAADGTTCVRPIALERMEHAPSRRRLDRCA